MLIKSIKGYFENIISDLDQIDSERKKLLSDFAKFMEEKKARGETINLVFICTHNSRRSQMGQILAQSAAEYFGIKKISCYSGGTETTAFNIRAVNALVRAGFETKNAITSENPVYSVKYSNEANPIECFSKIYTDPINPEQNFAAILTCSDADAACPVVSGAEIRFPIRYEDPKIFDNTELEEQMYDKRCRQIASEMIYAFSLINNSNK
ncbi:MAG: protein-tyrosine-phosphatase [Bacteroidetes bacterium]|nr:protein-tyrosine-phosphatase [Bacteroidota bacterium]